MSIAFHKVFLLVTVWFPGLGPARATLLLAHCVTLASFTQPVKSGNVAFGINDIDTESCQSSTFSSRIGAAIEAACHLLGWHCPYRVFQFFFPLCCSSPTGILYVTPDSGADVAHLIVGCQVDV